VFDEETIKAMRANDEEWEDDFRVSSCRKRDTSEGARIAIQD
jgi:hypothetical protein